MVASLGYSFQLPPCESCSLRAYHCTTLHVLAADGALLPDGRFVTLPDVPGSLLAEGFRRAVLEFLVNYDLLSEGLRNRMLGWRHCGFLAHGESADRGCRREKETRRHHAACPDIP